MKTSIYISIFLLAPILLLSQQKDSIKNAQLTFITDRLENLSQNHDREIDFSDLLEEYLYYYNNPVNLNGNDVDKLTELYLLNDIQLMNLKNYLSEFKTIYSLFELKNIQGFDVETIERIKPFVCLEKVKTWEKTPFKNALKYGKHQIIGRYSQIVEPVMGYRLIPDSAISHPGSNYLGQRFAYYLRYSFNYRNKIRYGLTLDRDAGELILTNNLSDTIKELIQHKASKIFDFYSAFAFYANKGVLKKAIIGDYHLEFGQGLTMWSGLAFGKSAESIQIKRFGGGIRPNTSANENRFLRGCATSLGFKAFTLTLFYSYNKVDATTIDTTAGQAPAIKSLQETGKHRTLNEILSKDALNIQLYGGRLAYRQKYFTLGLTSFQTTLSASLKKGDELYKLFNPDGNLMLNHGIDFSFALNKANMFGEFSLSGSAGMAYLTGINVSPADRFQFTIFYHNYGRKYHNIFANPFSENSVPRNEEGIYAGFKILLAKYINLNAYIDHYRFPWLKYRTDGPSIGRDYLIQLNISPVKDVGFYLRYRFREKQENYSDEFQFLHQLIRIRRNEFRLNLSYTISSFLFMKNRIEYINFRFYDGPNEKGYLIFQDILYRPANFPLQITFRYALFSTRGYNSRVYTYENDMLYAFSVPSFFGQGQRYYLMIKYKLAEGIDFWFRIAQTNYQNRRNIGSGADEIEGNKKTEIKFQMVFSL